MASIAAALAGSGTSKSGRPIDRLIGSFIDLDMSNALRIPEASMCFIRSAIQASFTASSARGEVNRSINQYVIRLKTSPGSSLARPPRKESSITKAEATTSAPVDWTRSRQARIVPPVASTSSISSTRSPAAEGIGVDFQLVGAVFQLIFECDRGVGELARLADRDESDAQLQGQGSAEDEPARLGGGDQVDPSSGEVILELIDRGSERLGMTQEWRDIFEVDARLGEVGDVADVVAEVDRRGTGHR